MGAVAELGTLDRVAEGVAVHPVDIAVRHSTGPAVRMLEWSQLHLVADTGAGLKGADW
jgi:hypothetical protein